MAVESPRVRARRELEELGLSVESALYLAEDRPPGGWDSLVTHDQLRAELAEVRTEIADVRTEIANLASELRQEMRDQARWFATAIIGSMSVSIAAMAIIGAALRFA